VKKVVAHAADTSHKQHGGDDVMAGERPGAAG